MDSDVKAIGDEVARERGVVVALRDALSAVVLGQGRLVDRLVMALLANGHVLLEGVPGLAKTLAVQSLSEGLDGSFARLQFTPDLLPADLVGTLVYSPKSGDFFVKKGPVFANVVLADEINRAPAKVQSALLEAMQERQVTIGDETFPLPDPFLVLATQNPIEQEGTYPLPEAQVDRFLFKVLVGYPDRDVERRILDLHGTSRAHEPLSPVVSTEDVRRLRELVDRIYVDEKIKTYAVELVHATREPGEHGLERLAPLVEFGASPRATLSLVRGARAAAFLAGRGYVTPQDVKDVAPEVLRHRLVLTYEAEARQTTADDVVRQVLAEVPVP
jgi:MoxR-like ATPase